MFMPAFYDFAGKRRASAGQASVKVQAGRRRTTASTPPLDASRSSTSPSSAVTSRFTIASPRPEPPASGAGAPEAVEGALALLRVSPGPSSRRWSSTHGERARADNVTVPPSRRRLERVGEEVVEHLREPSRRRAHRQRAVEVGDESDPVLVRERRPGVDALAHERRGVDTRRRPRRRRRPARARAGRRRGRAGDRPRAAPRRGRGSAAGSRAAAAARSAACAARARRRRRTPPASAEAARASRRSR